MDIDKDALQEAVKHAMRTPEPIQIVGAAVMVVVSLGTAVVNGLTVYQGIKNRAGK
jgi:uncharacterized membrane protein YhfC